HLTAEGRRAGGEPRSGGGVSSGTDLRWVRLQLHAAAGRRTSVPVRDDHPGAGGGAAGRPGRSGAMNGTRVLDIRGVTKDFDVRVLKGIDLAVGEHEAVALIGASGSGKSTLLRCIDLLEEID